MHGVRLTVIADDAKRLIWAKQTIRTTERLNDAFVVDNLIEIQRIHPFRVEPSEHLVYDNEQIKLLAAVRCYTTIRTLVRQSRRNILLHRRPCRNDEFFAERLVVIGDDFGQRILFVCRSFVVVDIGIEQRRHMQLGCLLLEQVIIIDSFRNGTGSEHRMEFARMAEHRELFKNVRDHHTRVRRVDTILVSSQEILDATDAVPGTINHRTHGDLRLIHVMLEYFGLDRVGERIFRTLRLRLVESHGTSDFRILVRGHHVRVEPEHIMVANAVGNAVSVQTAAEYHGSGGILLLVLIQNGCAGEAEEQRIREGTTDVLQHVAECGTMAFVHNKDDTLCS